MKTVKYFQFRTETQSLVVRVEAIKNHEEDAAIAASPHLESPIIFSKEIDGLEAAVLTNDTYIDGDLYPNTTHHTPHNTMRTRP
jgi:hypothetical protein